ncbi:MAG: hypothetical protein HY304_07645 [candidate division Zixibacteria bacterium]|nr:hypothetical protein [candidate division Zixibacteria bacterium]
MSAAQILVVKTAAIVIGASLVCLLAAPALFVGAATGIGVGLGGLVIGIVVPLVTLGVKFLVPMLLIAGVVVLLKIR